MIKPVPLATPQKLVLGQQGNRLQKTEWKEGIEMYLGFNIKLLFLFT